MSNPPRDGKGSVRKRAAEGKGIPAEARQGSAPPQPGARENTRATVTACVEHYGGRGKRRTRRLRDTGKHAGGTPLSARRFFAALIPPAKNFSGDTR